MKKILALLLVICLLLGTLPALAVHDELLGQKMPDFTVTTIDGKKLTLSELLKDKELVVLNLFATWCGPCRHEFPAMDEVYRDLHDRMEIVALSAYDEDTMEKVRSYRAELALSFPMGITEGTPILNFIKLQAYPTNLFIDRFGNIGFVYYTFPDADHFRRVCEAFLGDQYTRTLTLSSIPPRKSSVEYPDEMLLSDSLNTDDSLTFRNDPTGYSFPFVPGTLDGRPCAIASNSGIAESTAYTETAVDAVSGDALAFRFCMDAYPEVSRLEVLVDEEVMKVFSGTREWTDWALPLNEGGHTVAFRFTHAGTQETEPDTAALADVRLLSGEEARAALEAVPVYPSASSLGARVLNPEAREGRLTYQGMDIGLHFHMVTDPTLSIALDLPDGADPDAAGFYNSVTGTACTFAEVYDPENQTYSWELALDDTDAPADLYILIEILADLMDVETEGRNSYAQLICVRSEAGIDSLVDVYRQAGYDVEWEYVDP